MGFDGYQFWGMHIVWWMIWFGLLFWIYALPYDVPGQRNKKDSPLDILRKRYAAGEITMAEYEEIKTILDKK